MNNAAQVKSAINVILALSETLREVKEIPSGTLYVQVLGVLTLEQYQRCIDILKGAKLVEETPGHLLRWVGPEFEARAT